MPTALRNTVAVPLAVVLLAGAAFSTADLTRSGGILGQSVTMSLQGDPGEMYFLGISFNTGPTPLSLLDPSDPRSIDLGLDLLASWPSGTLDGSGQAVINASIPATPGLQGLPFHSQFITLPGVATVVDEISNLCSWVLGAPQTSTFTLADHVDQIDGHTATGLDDGSVLIAGGVVLNLLGNAVAIDDYHRFDAQTGAFELITTAQMTVARTQHTATKLADGRVLTLGGADENALVYASGEIFDPASGLSTPIAAMLRKRVGHTATLLADGRVFVAGGTTNFDFSDPFGALAAVLEQTEIYDPASNSWSPGPNLPKPRVLHSATRLGTGHVLITGGIEITTIFFIDTPDFSNSAVRYNPATSSFVGTADFNGSRALHGQVTLPNGDALLAGGVDGNLIFMTFNTLSSCRRYDASANTWTNVASMGVTRGLPNLIDAGGTIIAIGGVKDFDLTTLSGAPAQEIEITTPSVLSWTQTATMLLPRALAISTLYDGGDRILTTGSGDNGSGGTIRDLTAEIHIP
ncbi:MAG: hypothetical protein O7B99_15480 [Planctomycetota bacterium]|nr:hypothetical protein [Planctomycetota bacterium]